MAFQLTIHNSSNAPAQSFAPGQLHTFSDGTVRIGAGAHCQCRLPESADECLLISSNNDGRYAVESLPGSLAMLNSQELRERQELRSGDRLEVSGWQIHFFLVYPRAAHSWRSDALGRLAKAGIALVLAVQFLLIFILPEKLKDGNFWYGQQLRLTIVGKTDDLRRVIRGIDNTDPIVQALLAEYEQELLTRTRYLRNNTERLTRRQRSAMLSSLNRIENDIQRLQQAVLVPPPPAIDLDSPVREIIETIAYE